MNRFSHLKLNFVTKIYLHLLSQNKIEYLVLFSPTFQNSNHFYIIESFFHKCTK